MKIAFKNQWYLVIIIFAIIAGVYIQIINLVLNFSVVPIIHLTIILVVIFSLIYLKVNSARIVVKFWASVGMIGGGLGLISVLLLYLIGRLEGGLEIMELLRHAIHILIGGILFFCWNDSVKSKNKITSEQRDYSE